MSYTNRVDPRAKQLKDYYAQIDMSPRRAKESILLAPDHLEHLTQPFHISPAHLATTADERLRRIGKAITLALFIPEYKKQKRDVPFLQGLVFFWHTYLAPITETHPAPSVASVISHCANAQNLEDFILEAQDWVNFAYRNDPKQRREVWALLTPEHFRKLLLDSLPSRPTESERRTYGNYLNAAIRECALRLEAVVPEFFDAPSIKTAKRDAQTSPQPVELAPPIEPRIQVAVPNILRRVVSEMYRVSSQLPGLGEEELPVSAYLERSLDFRTLRGQPRVPSLLTGTEADVRGMSGFLSGVLGEGRTAFLKHLAFAYARAFRDTPNAVLAFYFSAKDFVIHARNRRSVYEFIAHSLATNGNSDGFGELPPALRTLDEAGKLLLLADDLDQLPASDRSEVLAMLTLSPAVVFAVLPWQVEGLAKMTVRPELGVFTFRPPDSHECEVLLDRVARMTEVSVDWYKVKRLFFELPHLARQPLGIITMLDQVTQPWTDMTQTAEKALAEYARRAGLPPRPYMEKISEYPHEWDHLESAALSLNSALRLPSDEAPRNLRPELIVRRQMVENEHGFAWNMKWDEVQRTGLFQPISDPQGEGLALVNLDLACYLIAQAALKLHWPCQMPQYPVHLEAVELLQRISWHWENLKHPNRHLPPKTFIPRPTASQPHSRESNWKALRSRFPKIFRQVS